MSSSLPIGSANDLASALQRKFRVFCFPCLIPRLRRSWRDSPDARPNWFRGPLAGKGFAMISYAREGKLEPPKIFVMISTRAKERHRKDSFPGVTLKASPPRQTVMPSSPASLSCKIGTAKRLRVARAPNESRSRTPKGTTSHAELSCAGTSLCL